ncbi:MAG: phosphatidate cytidylyltransferase [bacterium]
MLKQRILTAVIAIPAGLYVVLYSSKTVFGLLVAVLALIALDEFLVMNETAGFPVFRVTGVLAGLAVSLSFMNFSFRFTGFMLGLAGFLVFVTAVFYKKSGDRKEILAAAALTLFGVLLINWFLGHIIWMRGLPRGIALLVYSLLMIWANDSSAYFVGSDYGKRKMAPAISPNKTWEGFLGGLTGSLLVGLAGAPFAGLSHGKGLSAGLLVGILGPLGDLAQSFVKRTAGVKDSGNLFPGHGGMLDRFDSLIMAAPFLFYLFL